MKVLNEFEDRLSEVPRWTIVRTIQQQFVMDHSGRVAIYAPRIAIKYLDVAPNDYETLYAISRWALLHDRPEAFSGDIASPGKKWWMGVSHDAHYANRFDEHPEVSEVVREAVKAADYFDALVFLRKERVMGNSTLARITQDIIDNFHKSFAHRSDSGRMVDELIDEIDDFGYSQDPL